MPPRVRAPMWKTVRRVMAGRDSNIPGRDSRRPHQEQSAESAGAGFDPELADHVSTPTVAVPDNISYLLVTEGDGLCAALATTPTH